MTIKLNVPLVKQEVSMECWYASACMVAYYRSPGPRLGLPKQWLANKGISPSEFTELAKNEGLKPIKIPTPEWTTSSMEANLSIHGPLWCAGYWYGVPHIIVLTGVDGSTVYINDPDGPVRRQETMNWFNAKLAWNIPSCVMYHP